MNKLPKGTRRNVRKPARAGSNATPARRRTSTQASAKASKAVMQAYE